MAFGKTISTLFIFGLGLFVAGLLIQLFKDSLIYEIKEMFWIEGTPFLNIMQVGWNVVPIIIMVLGVICIILSGMEGRSQVVYQQ